MNNNEMTEMMTALDNMTFTHQGQTLNRDNVTVDGLLYLINMGLKQALGDVESVNRAPIMGLTNKGDVPANAWKPERRAREAKALGLKWKDTTEDRKALADAWITAANKTKFEKILNGELEVGETNGHDGGDEVYQMMKELVSKAIIAAITKANLSLPKTAQVVLPKGKDLTKRVREKLANADISAHFRAKAEQMIAIAKAADDTADTIDSLMNA